MKLRPRVPAYIVEEAEKVLVELEDCSKFWTSVLNDNKAEKPESKYTAAAVLDKCTTFKSVATSLNTMIDIADKV